jgi:hypothetical protein
MTDPLPSWNEGASKRGIIAFVRETTTHGSPMFTFSAVGVSAYQFGNFGTAAKLLHSFNPTQ